MDDNRVSAGDSAIKLGRPAWLDFYEKMRMDIIEAQCAVSSGRAGRAMELMEEMLRDAAYWNAVLACGENPGAAYAHMPPASHANRVTASPVRADW